MGEVIPFERPQEPPQEPQSAPPVAELLARAMVGHAMLMALPWAIWRR